MTTPQTTSNNDLSKESIPRTDHLHSQPISITAQFVLSVVCTLAVQDKLVVCIEVEYGRGVDISIGTILDPHKLTLTTQTGCQIVQP